MTISPWFRAIPSMKHQHVPLVTSQEGSRSCLLRNNSKNSRENLKKSTCFKCKCPFGLGHVRYARWFSMDTMEHENKAESMRRWRKEQKEKKRLSTKPTTKKTEKSWYVTLKCVKCTSFRMRNVLWVKTKIADLAKNFGLYDCFLLMAILLW